MQHIMQTIALAACGIAVTFTHSTSVGDSADANTGAERTLVHEAVINAPVADVWRMYTTDEAARKWMAPKITIDLRVGGTMRASYHPDSNLNDEHTIINRILAYEPERMIAIRSEQAPAGFGWMEQFRQTWSVTYFEPIGERRTKLRLVGLGYGEGPEWDELYAFFNQGNQHVLDLLKQQFPAEDATKTERVLELVHQLVGGEWIHESERPDGNVFRSRSVVERGPDGASLTSRGWLGHASGMVDHGRTIIYRAPQSDGGGVRFFNINENGAIASGEILLAGHNHLRWDWPATNLAGDTSPYRVDMRFEDDDTYHFSLKLQSSDGSWRQLVEADFTRVDRSPQRFRQMRDQ